MTPASRREVSSASRVASPPSGKLSRKNRRISPSIFSEESTSAADGGEGTSLEVYPAPRSRFTEKARSVGKGDSRDGGVHPPGRWAAGHPRRDGNPLRSRPARDGRVLAASGAALGRRAATGGGSRRASALHPGPLQDDYEGFLYFVGRSDDIIRAPARRRTPRGRGCPLRHSGSARGGPGWVPRRVSILDTLPKTSSGKIRSASLGAEPSAYASRGSVADVAEP